MNNYQLSHLLKNTKNTAFQSLKQLSAPFSKNFVYPRKKIIIAKIYSWHRKKTFTPYVPYSPLSNCRSTTAIYFKLFEPPLRSY